MGKANQAINVDKYNLLVSLRHIKNVDLSQKHHFYRSSYDALFLSLFSTGSSEQNLVASLRATGCNAEYVPRAGYQHQHLNRVLGLMISNGLVALSGALLAQYQGFADVNMGRGAIVIGLAAVIIGEAIFGRIFRNFALRLTAVILGSILYYLVLQVVIWMGIDTDLLKLLSAIVVALFLAFPYLEEANTFQ